MEKRWVLGLASRQYKENKMAQPAKHISSSFDIALYALKNDVLKMSSLTDRLFQSALEGLFNRNSELCDHVVAEDDEVDILESKSIKTG
jgi:phosphate transport system protein